MSAILETEIQTDPLARGYAGMTNQGVADSLNVEDRTRIRSAMSGDELFGQTDTAEFLALTDANKQMWVSFCARDSIDPASTANIDFVKYIFGNVSDTVAALAAARVETISRGVEIGAGRVGEGDVWDVRNG